jgi:hypothetical protein
MRFRAARVVDNRISPSDWDDWRGWAIADSGVPAEARQTIAPVPLSGDME